MIKRYYLKFLLMVIAIVMGGDLFAIQPVNNPIALHPKAASLLPKEFYFLKVIDERTDKGTVTSLLHPVSPNKAEVRPVELQGGDFIALQQFVLKSTNRNTALRPVVVGIKQCRVTETTSGNNQAQGKIDIAFAFYLQKDNHLVELLTYQGKATYSRMVNNRTVVESALSRSLIEGLKYFDNWINREAATNLKLVKGLKLHFREHQAEDTDTIYYHQRPLTWDDFKAMPRTRSFGAEVIPGFGLDQETEIRDGILHLTLITKVFLPKSAAWVWPDNKTPHVLNHEQRHFDLAQIVAQRFKKRVRAAPLSPETYEAWFGPEYFDTLRELTHLQTRYDNETRHGSDLAAQQSWNLKIDAELKGQESIK